MNKINICFVSKEYAHPNMGKTGGIGVFVKNMGQELSERNFNVFVFSFGLKKIRFSENGVQVFVVKDLSIYIFFILRTWMKFGILGYNKIKFTLFFLNKIYISILLTFFSLKNRIKVMEFNDYGGDIPFFFGRSKKIIRCHGSSTILNSCMGYEKRPIDIYFENIMFKNYSKNIIGVSKYSAEISKKAFNLKTSPIVIYNGVDTSNICNYRDQPIINKSLFYVGSLTERKGVLIACGVFNKLIEKYPDATFHLLGNNINDCWNKEIIKCLSPKALEKTIYYGVVKNSEVMSYLSRAHVVIFPSYGENFSIALLEALSIGKLVVTSNIPAFKEIISHDINGFIAKSNKEFVTLISQVFKKDEKCDFVKENAFKLIKYNFNIEKIIEENINFYKSIV